MHVKPMLPRREPVDGRFDAYPIVLAREVNGSFHVAVTAGHEYGNGRFYACRLGGDGGRRAKRNETGERRADRDGTSNPRGSGRIHAVTKSTFDDFASGVSG